MVNVDKTDMIPITNASLYSSGDLAYLTGEDTVVGSIISSGTTYHLSQVLTPLNLSDQIYSNGDCQIYYTP